MTTVHFHTPEALDLAAIYTMGLSSKPNTDSPIGQFGTGLKYALAILLREGQTVSLRIDGRDHEITVEESLFRGEPVSIPAIDGRPLPFTLHLGKGWALWQAFRELESNTRDENGTTGTSVPSGADEGTLISITGNAFAEVYANRNKYFLPDTPILDTVAGVEIRLGETSGVYYRGILVAEVDEPFRLTYNILNEVELTEDRTLKSLYTLRAEVGFAVNHATDERACHELARSENKGEADLANTSVSDTLLDALIARDDNPTYPGPWRTAIAKRQNSATGGYPPYHLTEADRRTVERAMEILLPLNVPASFSSRIIWVESLGKLRYGAYNRSTDSVYIARNAIEEGATHLAGTLFEEYAHRETGFADQTRAFQDYFLRRLINLAERSGA